MRSGPGDQPRDGARSRVGWNAGSRRTKRKMAAAPDPEAATSYVDRVDRQDSATTEVPVRDGPAPRARQSRQPPPGPPAPGQLPPRYQPPQEHRARRAPPPPPRGGYYQDSAVAEHRAPGYDGPSEFYPEEPDATERLDPPRLPRKITVTRVAAWRGRHFGKQAVHAFNRAARADGAWESGLTSLTYAVMLNYALMASMAVALANTLFFSAATAESKSKVALYLLITIAPFSVIAPVIGPILDKVQRGRRIAMATSCSCQALLCVVMALHFDDWLLYPAALGVMVMSKSFDVLKAAVAPRVLPSGITLSKTNARLMTFAMAAGGALGAVAAGLSALFGSPGALWFAMLLGVTNAVFCLRIPSRVEVTAGEVPASLSLRIDTRNAKRRRQPMGRHVVVALWGTGSIRMLTGFMMLFPAFVIKAETQGSGFTQVLLLGIVGVAAGGGSFLGNAIGSRKQFGRPEQMVIGCLCGALAGTVIAAVTDSLVTAAIAALLGAVASALAKNNLDSVIQDDLPEASRASAFSRSETILQLAWVLGGGVGIMLPATFWLGFTVISAMLAVGLVQTILSRRGSSLIPGLGGDRDVHPAHDQDDEPRRPAPRRPAPRGAMPPTPTRTMPADEHPR